VSEKLAGQGSTLEREEATEAMGEGRTRPKVG